MRNIFPNLLVLRLMWIQQLPADLCICSGDLIVLPAFLRVRCSSEGPSGCRLRDTITLLFVLHFDRSTMRIPFLLFIPLEESASDHTELKLAQAQPTSQWHSIYLLPGPKFWRWGPHEQLCSFGTHTRSNVPKTQHHVFLITLLFFIVHQSLCYSFLYTVKYSLTQNHLCDQTGV